MNKSTQVQRSELRHRLPLLLLIAAGAAAVGVGMFAVAQQPATPTAPATATTTEEPPAEDESLRQSADNNISFPVDI